MRTLSFLLDQIMQILVDIVHKYEGTVDKFAGDGLMALFGAPIAHENDAHRASVRARFGNARSPGAPASAGA